MLVLKSHRSTNDRDQENEMPAISG
jgi:hypothetical protein